MALKHFPNADKEKALARPILYSNWLSKVHIISSKFDSFKGKFTFYRRADWKEEGGGGGEFIRIEDTTTTSFSRILIYDQIPFLELHPRCTGGAEGLRQGQAQGLLRGGARRPSRPLQ